MPMSIINPTHIVAMYPIPELESDEGEFDRGSLVLSVAPHSVGVRHGWQYSGEWRFEIAYEGRLVIAEFMQFGIRVTHLEAARTVPHYLTSHNALYERVNYWVKKHTTSMVWASR